MNDYLCKFFACPKNYYQLCYIKGRKNLRIIIFIIFILKTYKFYCLYYQVFDNIKSLLKRHK